MSFECKECFKKFDSERGLHGHLKSHKIGVAEYYITHYPRFNKLSGNLLPFKTKEEYFENDFVTRQQLIKWCNQAPEDLVREYIIEVTKRRIKSKNYTHAPFHIELTKRQLPSIEIFKDHFGTYGRACEEMGVKPIFTQGLTDRFFDDFDCKIYIDTREQKPLQFANSELMKLDFGDYTVESKYFTNTFIDRKNPIDFASTFSRDIERFRKEMKRCVELDAYMYILVEKPLDKIEKEYIFQQKRGNRMPKVNWILSNMIQVQHEFPDNCQFVFVKNREQCEKIVPKLLCLGKNLWKTDLQYFIDEENILEEL